MQFLYFILLFLFVLQIVHVGISASFYFNNQWMF